MRPSGSRRARRKECSPSQTEVRHGMTRISLESHRLVDMATATAPVRQARRQKRLPAFEQFFAYRRLNPPATPPPIAFTPDAKSILFSADISGQFNIWRVSRSGGAPK